MEKKMKNRIVLLCCLLVVGMILVSIGNILGAGQMFQRKEGYVMNMNLSEQEIPEKWLEIAKKDPRVIELIEGKEYKIVGLGYSLLSGKKVDILSLTVYEKECSKYDERNYHIEIDLNQNIVTSVEEQLIISNALFEIAKEDPGVKELIAGREYKILSLSSLRSQDHTHIISEIVTITIEVDGKIYDITMDFLKDMDVISINDSIEEWDRAQAVMLEIAKEDPGVKELIEGKEWEAMPYQVKSHVHSPTLELLVDGMVYHIQIDMENKRVRSILIQDLVGLFEIIKDDPRIQKIISGKEYEICGGINWGDTAYVTVRVGERSYGINIDMEDKRVESIIDDFSTANLMETVKKDPGVQELIAGKEYKIVGSRHYETEEDSITVLLLYVEGRYYEITIDILDETVMSIENNDRGPE